VQPHLYRNVRNKRIAGVCGGLAERYGWDPTLVRVIFVLLIFVPIPTHIILVYLIMWAIVPKAPE